MNIKPSDELLPDLRSQAVTEHHSDLVLVLELGDGGGVQIPGNLSYVLTALQQRPSPTQLIKINIHRHVILDTILPELGSRELLPGDAGVPLGDGHADTDVGCGVVHGQDRVENVVFVGESHAVETVAGKQVARMFDDGRLG